MTNEQVARELVASAKLLVGETFQERKDERTRPSTEQVYFSSEVLPVLYKKLQKGIFPNDGNAALTQVGRVKIKPVKGMVVIRFEAEYDQLNKGADLIIWFDSDTYRFSFRSWWSTQFAKGEFTGHPARDANNMMRQIWKAARSLASDM